MSKYSLLALARHALRRHRDWPAAWRGPEPRRRYDVVIIGGGGHGLGAAYYLARDHGIRDVAVLEKGWIGGGNTGRNTMTIRSNYVRPASVPFHEGSMALYRGLSRELNYNIMAGERGMLTFLQSSQAARRAARMANTMHLYGSEYRFMNLAEIERRIPIFRHSASARLDVVGGVYQKGAMMARHDAVAWGFARAADRHGVDILQHCEVTGITRTAGRVTGVETTRGAIEAGHVGMAVSGHSSAVAAMVDLRLPVETQPLQAWVSEPVRPMLREVVVLGGYGCYLMQSDKGELVIGGATDPYPSYAQRGSLPIVEQVTAGMVEMFPAFKRLRLLRQWAGMIDIVYDGSPIISNTPVDGFSIDVAGAGGFKTTPMAAKMHADLIARGQPHPLIRDLGLDRFEQGRLVFESGTLHNR